MLMAGGLLFAQSSGTLVFGLSGNPDTLDPQKTSGTLTFQVVKSFYDTLVEPDTSGKIVPALAESWSVSPDGLTWTFRLRRDVVFHNGQQFTSRDVAATLNRILDEKTASPKRSEFTVIQDDSHAGSLYCSALAHGAICAAACKPCIRLGRHPAVFSYRVGP